MSGRGVGILGLVAVVVGLVALLLWKVAGDSSPTPKSEEHRTPAATAPASPPTPARTASAPAPATPAPTRAEPIPVPPPPTDDGLPLMHDARARVLTAARACIATAPDGDIPDESLEIEYTLEFSGDEAAIRDARIVASTLSDALIAPCVAKRIVELRWRITDTADDRLPVRDTLALRELVQ